MEMGKPHTLVRSIFTQNLRNEAFEDTYVTSESKKRDSGRILPPLFWRSRITSQVCNGNKEMNMMITLHRQVGQTAETLVESKLEALTQLQRLRT